MGWTDEMVAELKRMWDEGLTTGEIGKRLGVSKNSIVGKVHRLKLVSRPSPIKKKSDTSVKDKIAPKPAKEPLKAEEKTTAPKDFTKNASTVKPVETIKEENIKAEPITCAPPKKSSGYVTLTDLDIHSCRWPVGDPKDETFHFCGKKTRIGQTYCDEHAATAYVKTTKK